MAKPKELPNNKKWKSASKGTKAPLKNTVWKRLNTGKWHVSDAGDDNMSPSDYEPPLPPKCSRHIKEISNDQPESNIEVFDDKQVHLLQSLAWM